MSRETAQVKSARDSERTDVEPSPPYWAASLAGLLVFGLYALTLSRTTAFWDTSEYIATGHILGIPHQPGNPLFVVLSRAWSVLLAPLGVPVAIRFNLFSALMSAGAHTMWFLVVHHILCFFSEDRRFRLVGASAAVLVSATAFTVWNQSNVNEKVYTVSLLTIAVLSWLAFRWQERLAKGKDDNLLVLMAFLLALSVGNHLMAFLAAPAIGLFILFVHPQTLLNWRLYAAGIAAIILGLSIHLFLPIRAALDPVINEAAPTCENIGSALLAVVTYGRDGCELLAEALKRSQYEKPGLLPRLAPLWSQAVNYLQYFDWQWARSLNRELHGFRQLAPSVYDALYGPGRLGRDRARPPRPGQLHLHRHALRHAVVRAPLLHEFQVRLLVAGSGPGSPPSRSPRTRLLLHGGLFGLGTLGRHRHCHALARSSPRDGRRTHQGEPDPGARADPPPF